MKPRAAAAWLLAPTLLVLLVLFLLPQAFVLEASLARRDAYGGIVHSWGLHNYARALQPLYLGILARSFGLALATTAACLVLGYPAAYWLARVCPPRWRNALLVLVILPFWTSFLVRMYAWVFLLRSEGTLNIVLSTLGLGRLELLYRDGAVLLGQVYGELPFMILPLYAALERLDPALLEAAADLGAAPRRALWRVTLPLSRAGIAAGCVLVFIPSLGAYLAPDVLGGARTMYAGTLIQSQFAVARDMPFGSALSVLVTLLMLALVWALRKPLAAARAGH